MVIHDGYRGDATVGDFEAANKKGADQTARVRLCCPFMAYYRFFHDEAR